MCSEIATVSPTAEAHAQYRRAYAQSRYSLYDLTEHAAVGGRVTVREDRALLELAEFVVLGSAPLALHADPGWSGGWVRARYLVRTPIPTSPRPHPPVWWCGEDALAAPGPRSSGRVR